MRQTASSKKEIGPKIIVVGGTHSGCGKTLVSLALMAACVRRGLVVQAFKAGPDFIDPGHHALVTGRPSHNVDGWILGEKGCRSIVSRYSSPLQEDAKQPDVCIVEGVMGLYDGASGSEDSGSTAELAKWLGAPVLLVADTRSMARSVAAVVHGYTTLDDDLTFAGVVLNRVGSKNHQELLTDALGAYCPHVRLWGCLPRHSELETPSRHLGLVTAEDSPLSDAVQQKMAEWIESAIDVGELVESLPVWREEPCSSPSGESVEMGDSLEKKNLSPRIAVARDKAFCFYYEENLRMLKSCGATLVEFSPLNGAALPDDIDGIYLGGGYPELYARELSDNENMLSAIRTAIQNGVCVYAECGGFMYLTRGICLESDNGDLASPVKEQTEGDDCFAEEGRRVLVGHYPVWSAMQSRFRALGYRKICTTRDSILGPSGTVARGHEFHYSSLVDDVNVAADAIYILEDRKGPVAASEGYKKGQVLASYVHLHFGSNPHIPQAFVENCRKKVLRNRNVV